MRKILGLALGVTVMMMGYVEGMKGLTENNSEKRPGDSLASSKSKVMRKGESITTLGPSKPGTPPDVTALHSLNSSMSGEQEVAQQPVDVDSFYDYCYGIVLLLNNHPTPKATETEKQAYLKGANSAVSEWAARAQALVERNAELKDGESLSLFVRGVSLYLQDEDSLKTADTPALPAATTLLGYLRKLAGEDIWTSVEAQIRITLNLEQQKLSDEQRKQLGEALTRLADKLDGEDDDF